MASPKNTTESALAQLRPQTLRGRAEPAHRLLVVVATVVQPPSPPLVVDGCAFCGSAHVCERRLYTCTGYDLYVG